MATQPDKRPDPERIAAHNDAHRRLVATDPRRCFLTDGVAAVPPDRIAALLTQVAAFDAWTSDNDPHREHDFGAVSLDGTQFFWKFDYYDSEMELHSPDPSDPTLTVRVLTIMRADEY